jgi:hypothetical protein
LLFAENLSDKSDSVVLDTTRCVGRAGTIRLRRSCVVYGPRSRHGVLARHDTDGGSCRVVSCRAQSYRVESCVVQCGVVWPICPFIVETLGEA